MGRCLGLAFLFGLVVGHISAQEVFVPRDAKPVAPRAQAQPSASPDLHVEKAIAVQTQKIKAEPEPPAEGPAVSADKAASPTVAKLPTRPSAVPFPAKPEVRVVRKDTPFQTRAADSRMMAIGAKPVVDATPKREAIVSVPRATPNPLPAIATPPKASDAVAAAKPATNPLPLVVSTKPKKIETATVAKPDSSPAQKKGETAVVAAKPNPTPAVVSTALKKTETDTATIASAKPHPSPAIVVAPPKKIETIALTSTKIHGKDEQLGPRISNAAAPQPISFTGDTAFIKIADGFDFPVGKPDAQGYYKARGFRSHGHLGEDWDGVGGGDTDLGDPIYCIGDGVVVFARDCHMGWGNVLIVRHSYREGGTVKNIDSLYGHLQTILVKRGQSITRGQKIATMGNAHGLYDAHLHLEIRRNLEIGMSRAAFAKDFSNYYDPTTFIASHRHLQTGGGTSRVALNTFTQDARINWDKARNYSHAHTGGGSSESAAALKKAVAASKR